MLETALIFGIAVLMFFAVLGLSHRHRPAACVVGAYLLMLIDPHRGPGGEHRAGPGTGLAVFILIGVALAVLGGAGRHLRHH
jgi:hypothetical protein